MHRNTLLISLCSLAACGPPDAREANRELKTGVAQQALQVCAGGPTVDGIDVSEWQGAIDWNAVASTGIAFAITRINDGGHQDPYFAGNWAAMKQVGLIRGAYQFYEPSDDPAWQANLVVSAVGRLGPGDLPVTLDVEWPSGGGSPTVAQLQTWRSIVEAGTGKAPMIYTALGYWNQYFGGDFNDLTLWVANYGVNCPNLPAGWGGWTFWQWGGTGIAGIGGNVDHDVFNGDLGALKRFAGQEPPRGYLDVASCDGIAGWAQDPKDPGAAIDVHVYLGGPAGSGAPGVPLNAGADRADLCAPLGSCNHAFDLPAPYSLMDGQPHEVHAYGIDPAGVQNAELAQSPATFTCRPEVPQGVLRHVQNPDDFAAWGFSALMDVRPLTDAELAATPRSADLPHTPRLVQAAGDPAVYLIDNGFKRHVTDPGAAASWHFDLGHLEPITAEDLAALPLGPVITGRPLLVRASGPEIDVLDAPFPAQQVSDGAATPPALTVILTGAHAGNGSGGPLRATGGCTAFGGGPLAFAALLALRRRARRARGR